MFAFLGEMVDWVWIKLLLIPWKPKLMSIIASIYKWLIDWLIDCLIDWSRQCCSLLCHCKVKKKNKPTKDTTTFSWFLLTFVIIKWLKSTFSNFQKDKGNWISHHASWASAAWIQKPWTARQQTAIWCTATTMHQPVYLQTVGKILDIFLPHLRAVSLSRKSVKLIIPTRRRRITLHY